MAGFIQNLLGENFLGDTAAGFFGNDYLRDFQHASKVFRTNGYAYSPKYKFLFHVYFKINDSLEGITSQFGPTAHFGLAVKTINLPSFSLETHQLNQYNRKRVVQTKVKYDDISINFHDDNANLIRNLWYTYFTYYYKDSTKQEGDIPRSPTPMDARNNATSIYSYSRRNIYDQQIGDDADFGYIGETYTDVNTAYDATFGKPAFFKYIDIFGFNQHKFVQYRLLNPLITSWKHDTYDYAASNGTMEHTMGVAYEGVKYYEGAIDGRSIASGGTNSNVTAGDFGKDFYDTTLSPIARPGANQTVFGQGGLVDAAGGFVGNLTGGNILGAIATAGRGYNTFKNGGLQTALTSDLRGTLNDAVRGTPNRNVPFTFPANRTSGTTPTAGPTGI
jgi:hypothetical protein